MHADQNYASSSCKGVRVPLRFSATLATMIMAAVIIIHYYFHLFREEFVITVVIGAAAVFLIHLFIKYRTGTKDR
jgi:hypothetical protein